MSEVNQPDALPDEGYSELEPPDCRLAWQQREEFGVIRAYCRTAWLVIRHPGRLGDEVGTYVDSDSARGFRSMTMTCAVISLAAYLIVACLRWSSGLGMGDGGVSMLSDPSPSHGELDTEAAVVGLLVGGGLMLLAWVFLRLALGTAKWFFVPPSMPLDRQLSSRWLVQYLSAPLALLAGLVPLAGLSCVPGVLGTVGLWAGGVWIALVAAFWLVTVLRAMRAMTGIGGRKLILRDLGLLVIWIILALGIVIVPLSIPVLMLMNASLT